MGTHSTRRNDTRPDVGDELDVDEVLDLLSRRTRREVIRCCRQSEEQPVEMDALVDHVGAARERAGEHVDVEQVEAELLHVHLPRLAEHGVVDYDTRSGDVRYWGSARLECCLEFLDSI